MDPWIKHRFSGFSNSRVNKEKNNQTCRKMSSTILKPRTTLTLCVALSLIGSLLINSVAATVHIDRGVMAWCRNSQHYCGDNCGHGFETKRCIVGIGESYLSSLCNAYIAYNNCKQQAWDDCIDWAQAAVQNSIVGGVMGGISRVGGSIHRGAVIGGAVGASGTYLGSVAFCLADSEYRARKAACVRSRDELRDGYRAIYVAWSEAVLSDTADVNRNGLCDNCE